MELKFTPCQECQRKEKDYGYKYLCQPCILNRYEIRIANAALKHVEDTEKLTQENFVKSAFEKAIKENTKIIRQQMKNPLARAADNILKDAVSIWGHNRYAKQTTKRKPMLTATKIFTFDSAHFLQGHPGLCKNVHGHTYKLEVTFQKDQNQPVSDMNPPDMVLDFGEIKKVIKKMIIDKFDHQLINEVPIWRNTHLRPTAENMVEVFAKWIRAWDSRKYKNNLVQLRLWETPTSYATWTKED